MELALGQQIERYLVEAVIGEGGQGRVYRVRHERLGTVHALKVVLNASAGVRERLLREGRAQAQLVHPNIVRVTDVIDVGTQPGLVMEYITGPSLDDLLAAQTLTVAQADELAQGILAGLQHAHSGRFVHRDLKPMNILCAIGPTGPIPKIADFGLVKALGAAGEGGKQTRTGVMMGSALYMSPEQIRSTRSVDERSDLWAMGVILYELLTGVVPFSGGDDLFETFGSITRGEYTPVREVRPEVPERMEQAIDAALKIDPDERVSDAGALLALWRGEAPAAAGAEEGSGTWDMNSLTDHGFTDEVPSGEISQQTWSVDGTLAEDGGLVGSAAEGDAAAPAPEERAPAVRTTASRTLVPTVAAGMLVFLGVFGGAMVLSGLALVWVLQGDGEEAVAADEAPDVVVPVTVPVDEEPPKVPTEPPVGEATDGDESEGPDAPPAQEVPEAPEVEPVPRPTPPPKPVPEEPPPPTEPSSEPPLGTLTVSRAGLSAADQFFLANARGVVVKDGDPVPAGTWKVQYRKDQQVETLDAPIIRTEEGQGVTLTCSAMPRCRHRVE